MKKLRVTFRAFSGVLGRTVQWSEYARTAADAVARARVKGWEIVSAEVPR